MKRRSLLVWLFKWLGIPCAALIVFGFVYSTQRRVLWISGQQQHAWVLLRGTLAYGWRTVEERQEESADLTSGWSVLEYGDDYPTIWWFHWNRELSWDFVQTPLWVLLIFVLAATAYLWYLDRQRTLVAIQRLVQWLTPNHRVYVKPTTVLFSLAIHLLAIALAFCVNHMVVEFLKPGGTLFRSISAPILACLLWMSPLWAVLWARQSVVYRNRLHRKYMSNHCVRCGYDLTGNASGVCPECGFGFDPTDKAAFATWSKHWIPVGAGFALAGSHFAMTLLLSKYSLSVAIRALDDPMAPRSTLLADVAGVLANILMQPLKFLWNKEMSQNVPVSVEWLLFTLNSCLWGFTIAILWRRLRHRRVHPRI